MRPLTRLLYWEIAPRDHRESAAQLRRRQWVTVAVLLVGSLLLGFSLRLPPGSAWFIPATFALGALWVAGAFGSGQLHLGRYVAGRYDSGLHMPRPVLPALLVGLLLAGLFLAGGLVVARVGFLADAVRSVLDHATSTPGLTVLAITVVNGVAEEIFFRGALYAAITRHPVLWSTVIYTVVTAFTGNLMLTGAAAFLGAICALQRRATGGVLAPAITHVVWSTSMLYGLPIVF